MEITVLKAPALADLVVGGLWSGPGRAALEDGSAIVADELRRQTHGAIADGWATTVQPLGEVVAVGFTNPHPGVRPLDQGATWPGAMPPWGPPGSGLLSFPAARALKERGLPARHFVSQSLAATHTQVLTLLWEQGVRRWIGQ